MKLLSVEPTPASSEKKLVATFCQCPNGKTVCKPSERKTIQFGSKGSLTYSSGATDEQKDAYIARHSVREDFNKIGPASLSRYILWSAKTLKQGIANFKAKFHC
jgi:uncharacterized FAD-dependent dehydrogenase